MLLRIITVSILFLSLGSFSQETTKPDSLLSALESIEGIDQVNILLELSEEFRFEEKGIEYAQNALSIAEKYNHPLHRANAIFAIGRYYYVNFEENKALNYFFQSLDIYKSLEHISLVIKTQRTIGKSYFYLDSLNKSNEYLQNSLQLARDNNDKIQEAEVLIDLGELLAKKHQCQDAFEKQLNALGILKAHGTKQELYRAYNSLGKLYYDCSEFQKSIEAYLNEIEIRESLNDLWGAALARHNLGRTHRTIGNFQLALEQYQISLSISEKLRDKRFIAANSSEIGLIYENLARSLLAVEDNEVNFRRALSFHESALDIYEEQQDKRRIAETLNNIANTHSRLAINKFVSQYGEFWEDSLYQISSDQIMSTFGEAFKYYNQALDIFEETENIPEIIKTNINLGSHYIYARNWAKSSEHLNKGFRLAKQINSQMDIAIALFHFGDYFLRQENLVEAEQNLKQSLRISEDLGIKDVEMHTNQRLAKVYEQAQNLSKALKHIKKYNLIKDEIFSEQSQKIITEMQTKYETEKKEQEIKLLNNERALQHSVIQRQRLTIAIAIGGIIVILAFAGLLINMIRQKQRANRILKEKNDLISEQKQEITDSIRYASRIQNAILPSTTILNESLKEHFVLFIPRDIVSGDFYWFTKQKNKMIIVAADCTGHGVPGAFMSMLGVSFLYEIVTKEGIMQPAKILDTLRDFVKLTLSQTGKKDEQKDGMDISLSMLDLENMKLEWAGAYNPLVLIRNNEIIEYKADKMPVAIHITDHQSFTNHEIELLPGDTFYMYSDGFPDQFGGDQGRKYMSKRFKQLLLDIHMRPMPEQKEILHKEHLDWRGDHEQIDDVVVFGVRV